MAISPASGHRLQTFITKDGSPSLYDEALEETYHSSNGAIAESQHVFIERGFYAASLKHTRSKPPLHIFEVGFGTGINAWLTLKEAAKAGRHVIYESIDPYPIEEAMWKKLAIELDKDADRFEAIHRAPWEQNCRLGSGFELRKRKVGLESLTGRCEAALIYYDAFAAKAHPGMWEKKLLNQALKQAGAECVLVTYASKGSLKRTLHDNSWDVEILEGAPGKREMMRGIKSPLK